MNVFSDPIISFGAFAAAPGNNDCGSGSGESNECTSGGGDFNTCTPGSGDSNTCSTGSEDPPLG